MATTTSTQPISSTLVRRARGVPTPIALIVAHPNGVEVTTLRPGLPLVVGRGGASELKIPDAGLSREHARFRLEADWVSVEDLGSTNGTWHEGRRVERVEVRVGDEVLLGGLRARVVALGAQAVATPPIGPSLAARSDQGRAVEDPPVAGERMQGVFAAALRLANARIPVLLHGETGTGKEVLARLLHAHSPRRGQPMASLNCAAIPAELLESQLFGHERGAFTGAVQRQHGVFEEASGGTLFLDEVAELPPPAQAALLRVLEIGRVCRVGSSREVAVDVRVLSATHRDLQALCAGGGFRQDLYFRLNGVTLSIPPLRERVDEIEPLARRFLRSANEANRRAVRSIRPEALELLRRYAWPGNVRELRHAVERAVVIAEGEEIRPVDLPPCVRAPREAPATTEDFRAQMTRHEAQVIREALARAGGNRTAAAQLLGMPRRTLFHKIQALGLKGEGC